MITITLKGIPKETHRELKKRAAAHGRSLNREAISVLESGVRAAPVDAQALIAKARAVRATMKFKATDAQISRWKREGRE